MFKFINNLPDRLKRVTTSGRIIQEIDGLRFLAIMPVVIQHISERLERNGPPALKLATDYDTVSFLGSRGFVGVYLFFLISGFILSLPFASHEIHNTKPISLKKYFIRRLTRLEPPYLVIMTIIFVVLLITGYRTNTDLTEHYLASLVYLHSIIYNNWSIINPPAWTLEIEVQFYIMAPFLAMAIFKIRSLLVRRFGLIILILTILLTQDILNLVERPYILTILGQIHYFIIGFLCADIFLIDWKKGKEIVRHYSYDLLGFVSIVGILFSWSWDHELLNRTLFAIFLFLLFISSFKGRLLNKFVINGWVTAIGGMCYTIYLIHLPIAEILIGFTKGIVFTQSYSVSLIIQLFLIVPIIMVISIFLFLTLEKPCMQPDWPKQLIRRLKVKEIVEAP